MMFSWLRGLLFSNKPDTQTLLEEGAIIVDVRTTGEYNSAHGEQSRHIPLASLSSKIAALKKQRTTIVTCCASGMRSGKAAKMLKQAGIPAHNGGPWQRVEQARQRAEVRD